MSAGSRVASDNAAKQRPVFLRHRRRLIAAAAVAAVLLLLGGIALGRLMSPAPPLDPSTTSAEAGFARDMQTHHQQAVQLAMIIRAKTENPALLTLSYDIATSQAQQAGQMYGWLASWGLPQASPEPPMTWMMRPASTAHAMKMPMPSPGDRMPGLATQAQIDELTAAPGSTADKLFLTLMIAHHEGGIGMAQALLERSTNDVAVPLARGIVSAQQSEVEYMRELLASE